MPFPRRCYYSECGSSGSNCVGIRKGSQNWQRWDPAAWELWARLTLPRNTPHTSDQGTFVTIPNFIVPGLNMDTSIRFLKKSDH